jgi:hypothetical protein
MRIAGKRLPYRFTGIDLEQRLFGPIGKRLPNCGFFYCLSLSNDYARKTK